MILTPTGFLEYRREKDFSSYPFTTRARLRNRDNDIILENTFIDLSLYPVGISNGAYVSQVEIAPEQIVIRFGDDNTNDIASAVYPVNSTAEEIEILDNYGMPAGVILSDPVRMNSFRSWAIGLHNFEPGDTELVAAVVIPQPAYGVKAFLDDNDLSVSGEVWLIAEDGVVFGVDVELDTPEGSITTVTVNITGDPLFKRRLCDPANEFTSTRYLKSIEVRHPGGTFTVTPNAYGMVGMSINNALAEETPLRMTADKESMDFSIAGGRSTK